MALLPSRGPLTEAHDVALLDLDGVVYRGPLAVPGAAEAVGRWRAAGCRAAFVTNNALRTPAEVAEHLTRLEVGATPDEVVTSAQAAATLLAGVVAGGARVLVAGGRGLVEAVEAVGLRVTDDPERAEAVVNGYDPALDYERLARAALALHRGVPWVASNLDSTVPTDRGVLPGNGALTALLATATGRTPVSAGKPQRALHDEAVRRTGAQRPLVVGDRLDTDVEGARAVGCPSLLVLTGITDLQLLVRAEPRRRPTHLARDLGGLHHAHPAVERTPQGWGCGCWEARPHGEGVQVRPRAPAEEQLDDGLDRARAVVALCWDQPHLIGPQALAELEQ